MKLWQIILCFIVWTNTCFGWVVYDTETNSSEFIHYALENITTEEVSNGTSDFGSNEVPSPEGRKKNRLRQSITNDTLEPMTMHENTTTTIKYSDEFLKCTIHSAVEKEYYEFYPNGSVYVAVYNRLYEPTDYVRDEESGNIHVCSSILDGKSTTNNNTLELMTKLESTTTTIKYSDEFLKCAIQSAVEKENYELYPNGSVYVAVYNKLYEPTDYVRDEESGNIYVCSSILDVPNNKFSPYLPIITLVGTAISSFFILLHIFFFLVFEKLRNLPGYSLFFLCIALLVAYICLFITYGKDSTEDCRLEGIIKAYSFLVSFFWMNAMSYDIWRSLRTATNKLRLTADRSMHTRLATYSAYAWGLPLVIIIISLIVDRAGGDVEYKLIFDSDTCWFKHRQALLVYFALPIFLLLGFNFLLFVSSFYMINSATMNTVENKADLWSRFLVCIRLGVAMGLIWIFAILAAATDQEWLYYLSVFCTALQGVFIFFSFTITKKMKKECRKALQRRKTSTFPTQTSTHQSTSV